MAVTGIQSQGSCHPVSGISPTVNLTGSAFTRSVVCLQWLVRLHLEISTRVINSGVPQSLRDPSTSKSPCEAIPYPNDPQGEEKQA